MLLDCRYFYNLHSVKKEIKKATTNSKYFIVLFIPSYLKKKMSKLSMLCYLCYELKNVVHQRINVEYPVLSKIIFKYGV